MEAIIKQTANDNRSINPDLEWELDKWLHLREREPEHEAFARTKYVAVKRGRAIKLYLDKTAIIESRGKQCDIEC